MLIPKIIRTRYPDISEEEVEEVRQHVVTDSVVKNGEIKALFNTEVIEIKPTSLRTRNIETREEAELPNDFVFALTGYHADYDFLRRFGIVLDSETLKPVLNPETLESNVPGIYLAGVVIAGKENNKVFIENGRFHGEKIAEGRAVRLCDPAVPGVRPQLGVPAGQVLLQRPPLGLQLRQTCLVLPHGLGEHLLPQHRVRTDAADTLDHEVLDLGGGDGR